MENAEEKAATPGDPVSGTPGVEGTEKEILETTNEMELNGNGAAVPGRISTSNSAASTSSTSTNSISFKSNSAKSKSFYFKLSHSPTFALFVVGMAILVDTLVYSIIIPLLPFIFERLGYPVEDGHGGGSSTLIGVMIAIFGSWYKRVD